MAEERRTVPEVDRAAAARRAVERRRARASLKRDLTMRVVTPQAVLHRATEDPDSVEGSMRITDFLLALPAIGALAFARPLRPNPILDTQEHA